MMTFNDVVAGEQKSFRGIIMKISSDLLRFATTGVNG